MSEKRAESRPTPPHNLQGVEEVATQLQHAAADLLDGGLRETLEGYGRVEPTGSFVLGLMAWRDLDIRVVRDEPDREAFFAFGAKLLRLLHPHKMSYRDELLAHTPGLPRGLYWGIYLGDERAGAWKIDIWAIDEKEYEASQQDLDQLARNIDRIDDSPSCISREPFGSIRCTGRASRAVIFTRRFLKMGSGNWSGSLPGSKTRTLRCDDRRQPARAPRARRRPGLPLRAKGDLPLAKSPAAGRKYLRR